MRIGLDSLIIARMKKSMALPAFMTRTFTENEQAYAQKFSQPADHYAGLFCAKEAFLKATEWGIGGGVALAEIEIGHRENGAPYYILSANAKQKLEAMGFSHADISITHTQTTAMAICLLQN